MRYEERISSYQTVSGKHLRRSFAAREHKRQHSAANEEKRTMKRMLMLIVMAMSCCAIADTWTDPATGISWEYMISSGEASIGTGTMTAAISKTTMGTINIPSTIGDYSVTSIGNYAFRDCSSVTRVVIPKGVKEIGSYAFYGCNNLTCLEIPEGVQGLGAFAFAFCDTLQEIRLPASISRIDRAAFWGCFSLSTIDVAEENSMFKSISGVLYSKDNSCVLCCPSATSILVLSETTGMIGELAFGCCDKLETVHLPVSITNIANEAFNSCWHLKSMIIPINVEHIGYGAFYGCNDLQNILFEGLPPNGLSQARVNQDVAIRYNVEYEAEWLPVIAECGFTNASPYTPPKYDGGPYVETVEGAEWTFVVTNWESVVRGLDDASGSVTIPSTLGGRPVTAIDHSAFLDCGEMTAVTIPASVTEIGSVAFSGCEKLADVWFEGNTIGKIGRHAFLGCYWDLIMHVPAEWQGRGRTIAGYTVWRGESSDVEKCVNMTVTNVVVQYVLNSIQPEIAVPVSNSVGFVNIITEVASSGAVSVPTEWKDNYQQFETKFGTDFGKALAMKTGKKDGAGNDMFVWQDFVAGTDPTDENDRFTASITIVDGVPVISYTPELTPEQAALRVYKTYGKMKLTDTAWTDITAKTSEERADYNFFKVSVEMK